jgi:hypothetical protein
MSGALWPRNESSRLSIGGSLPSLKEELAAQIDLVEHRIRELKADLSALRKAHRSLSNRVSDVPTATKKAKSQPAGRWSGGSDAATLRDFVRSTLAREGKPLGRKELFARIEAAGITLDSKVPLKRLSKVMWESEEFTYTPSGYWFAEGFEARFTKES